MSDECLNITGGCGLFVIILGVFAVVMTQLVFATMGLAHGVPNLQNPPNITDCDQSEDFPLRMMYIWLVVEGSLVWGSMVLGILIPGPEVETENGEKKRTPGPFSGLVQLASFAWIIYGCVIVYNEDIFSRLESCDDWGAHLMNTMATLFVVFYSILAGILVLGCFGMCCAAAN